MGLIWAPTLGVVWQRNRDLETQLSGPANPGVDFSTNLNDNLYQHEQERFLRSLVVARLGRLLPAFGPFPMSRSEPTSPKRSRTDETTVVDYPTGTFKARAPAVHACRAHDKKRLCTDQIHSSTRAHLHPDARQCPHRTDPEMTTDTR